METGNKQEMNLILRQYKEVGGAVKYNMLFDVPKTDRITALAKNDFQRVNFLIIGALTVAFEGMNFKRPMNEIQILDLSEAIIDTAGEDNLAFEDLMLFLQKLVRGEFDISYESMDIPKFMKVFEIYRTERWDAALRLRDDKESQFKISGNPGRTSQPDPLSEHFAKLGNTMSSLRENVKELRQENKKLKDIDNF